MDKSQQFTRDFLRQAISRHQSGDLDGARTLYERVLDARPDQFDALHYLGVLAMQRGDSRRALALLDKALQQQPRSASAWENLGTAYALLDQPAEAENAFRRTLELTPDSFYAAEKLAHLALRLGKLEQAKSAFEQAIQLRPAKAGLYHGLGLTLRNQGHWKDALAAWNRALAIEPEQGHVLSETLFMRRRLCLWDSIDELQTRFRNAVAQGKTGLSPFVFLGISDNRQELRRCARAWGRQFVPQSVQAFVRPKKPEHPITIGYLSADFRQHPTAQLITGVLEHHDRERFRVIAYSTSPDDGSANRQRIMHACHDFVDLYGLGAQVTAQRMKDDGVDILVDLMGYTSGATPGIPAKRAAPVQVNWLGFPGTMGVDYMDYLIADPTVIADQHREDYSESVVRLPECYQPHDNRRKVPDAELSRSDCGIAESAFVFCCFNQLWKLDPELFALWVQILKAVPGSVLWLLASPPDAGIESTVRNRAGQLGVDGERVVFAPHRPVDQYLDQYRVADLFLDTFPYGAHTTASDALWMGCPVLTRQGPAFAGRVAASLLKACKLPELITTTAAEYERRAVHLARDPYELQDLRQRLERQRASLPLFDTAAFTRHLERAFAYMMARYLNGDAPQGFDVTEQSVKVR